VTVRVLVADDQPLMRAALVMCLSAEPDFEVVGEATDGLEAIELAQTSRPDVAVMDIRMPNLNGVAATRAMTELSVKVLIVTTFDIDEYVVEALRAGASGFVLKDVTPQELVHAVQVIAGGDALLAPAVTRRLLDRYASRLPLPGPPSSELLDRLTGRELKVLELVALGLSNLEIGQTLHIAPSSVKTHIGHVLAKLGLNDRVHLVIFAYEHGVIQPGVI
jgi:DNA-binding NarL/FixJ family response regulator